jgi:DUF1365 family protein
VGMNFLYECQVAHARLKPKRHAFDYAVFMFSVNLDDLPMLDRSLIGFSHNRFNLFSIHDADHIALGKPGGIRGNLVEWLSLQGVHVPEDAMFRLVTFPRVLGYGFNPVSFYHVSAVDGRVLAVVAEVVNTFREMKLYQIDHVDADGVAHRRVAKNFYVSPFSDPGMEFDFKIGLPGENFRVNIDVYAEDERVLLSAVRGERRELRSARLFWYALKYPLLSFRIIGLIHWHAFLLWIRKVPFFRKSERREVQLDVLRPHTSLKKDPS